MIDQDTRRLKMKVSDVRHPVQFNDDEGDEFDCTWKLRLSNTTQNSSQ